MARGIQCNRCKKFINTSSEYDDRSNYYAFIAKDSHRRFDPEFHLCPSCYHELKHKFLNNIETNVTLKNPDLNGVCEKIQGYELDPSNPVCSSEINHLVNKEMLETNCDTIVKKFSPDRMDIYKDIAKKLH